MKEVSQSEFYKTIGNMDVIVWVPEGFGCTIAEFKSRGSGNLIGFSTESISIDDSCPDYSVTTYYIKK